MPEPIKLDPIVLDAEAVLNRTQHKWPGWWDNFAQNLPYARAGRDLSEIPKRKGPGIVIGAGPSLTTGQLRLVRDSRSKLTVLSADRSLKTLLQVGISPDFVATVDGEPSVADFYNLTGKPGRLWPAGTHVVLNAVTTHPRTVSTVMGHYGSQVYWFVSFFDDPQTPSCPTCRRVSPTAGFHFMTRKMILQALGNVGALCWHLAYFIGCNPVILLGMDYSYQPGTPIETTHYYDAYLKIAAREHIGFEAQQSDIEAHVKTCLKCKQRVRASYQTKTNPDFKQDYITDNIWTVYRQLLLPFMQRATCRTINCSGGALHGPGITGMSLEEALAKF